MLSRVTARGMIQGVLDNMHEGVEPSAFTTLVAPIYQVHLHKNDYDRLQALLPKISDEIQAALDTELARLNEEAGVYSRFIGRLKIWIKGASEGDSQSTSMKYQTPPGGWQISFAKDEELVPGEMLIISELPLTHSGKEVRTPPKTTYEWDVFISHASEDKKEVVRPLAANLKQAGIRIWLDEVELKLGDKLWRKIDRGLAESQYAIVILSKAFFAKDWPQRELNAVACLESDDRTIILPVWHGIDQREIARYSPMLASKVGISTSRGIDTVVQEILRVVRPI